MIRTVLSIFAVLAMVAVPAHAQGKRKPDPDSSEETTTRKGTRGSRDKGDAETKSSRKSGKDNEARDKDARGKGGKQQDARGRGDKGKDDARGKPVRLGTFGDWGAFSAQGKGKTCYALAQPKDRTPAGTKRDAAYLFVSNQPNERISIIMGFPMKDNSTAKAEIGGSTFDLICKGANAWLENPNKEDEFIDTMRRGSRLVIKASSAKGNLTTDAYSLAGLSDALARVQKDCP